MSGKVKLKKAEVEIVGMYLNGDHRAHTREKIEKRIMK